MRRPLSPTLAKLAEQELNETPDRIQQDLIILRVWIKQQPHLRARTEDDFLIAFLRRCRYSLEETKRRLDRYFTYYNFFPEVMSNRCVTQRLQDINRLGVCLFPDMPKCDNRSAIFIARFGQFDPNQYMLREIYHFASMAMEIVALENDYASVAGICEIIDLEGVSSDKIRRFDKTFFRKWWNWLYHCSPLKVKEVYIINMPKDIQSTIMFLYNVLSLQVDYPIRVLKNPEELHEHIGRDCLPEEYGGTNGHMGECIAYMEDLLNIYRRYFEMDCNYGTIEELRSGEIAMYEAEFGASGSFRRLNWD
ncbi:alpha-tocopherol transfer protein-like [Scaptodrosophila lebanonensis]|uniref:Alpha-tocopherol transfer protein-like n=1 Tax=Drosophila lebanonensis TaxID=7225 RepID=A0A6J2T5N2_DROLE|nr:alpha-tocopherol transfer protein-like [Scaptodrosophila lebanonensis]